MPKTSSCPRCNGEGYIQSEYTGQTANCTCGTPRTAHANVPPKTNPLSLEERADLRRRVAEYEGVELEFGLHFILRGLISALDQVDESEKAKEAIYGDFKSEKEKRVQAQHAADWEPKCQEYLKDGETPADCLERYHKEVLQLLNLLANAKTRAEAAEAERDSANAKLQIFKEELKRVDEIREEQAAKLAKVREWAEGQAELESEHPSPHQSASAGYASAVSDVLAIIDGKEG